MGLEKSSEKWVLKGSRALTIRSWKRRVTRAANTISIGLRRVLKHWLFY